MIRRAIPADIPRLIDIWESAVRKTHLFLTEADIQFYLPQVRDIYLPALEVWLFENTEGTVGLIGLDGRKVEMLFVDPALHSRGIGKALLAHAQHLKGKLSVDVNEQNPAALAFYLHCGFVKIGRSELDGQGKPFPLIHLAQPE
ncbi:MULTISPECIES: GNAT family N-acetyltransferase [Yersinia]|uniref:GNAT family N-acetyltransferase n=1 Tax=Yersinia TaxID=629 RepID=UPI0005EA0B0C|nr:MULTISPECIES: GNAT family N-acetyltransferase [Yersinia]OVZ96669.1 GNAT family N-acetyltransferase [Yersinia frederiksenii]RXA94242.1 GNAT family N-acetyltransferase [Yersinia sp. 2105 StPb PI]CNI96475.1 putative acetyltransferase [Yersinia frederiksenii]CNJ18830.1 putative acetyltransferase [Yersinia frederiksenii]CNL15493.1 putative acetyltransferase [Yersinia frederiksenii]